MLGPRPTNMTHEEKQVHQQELSLNCAGACRPPQTLPGFTWREAPTSPHLPTFFVGLRLSTHSPFDQGSYHIYQLVGHPEVNKKQGGVRQGQPPNGRLGVLACPRIKIKMLIYMLPLASDCHLAGRQKKVRSSNDPENCGGGWVDECVPHTGSHPNYETSMSAVCT